MLVQRRAILTLPVAEPCWPKRIPAIQDGRLRRAIQTGAEKFLRVKALEGYDYVEKNDIHVYGPFDSLVELEAYVSDEHMAVNHKEREQLTRSRGSFFHYLLNADFIKVGETLLERSA